MEPLGFLGGDNFEKISHFKNGILSKARGEDKAQPNIEYPIATTGAQCFMNSSTGLPGFHAKD